MSVAKCVSAQKEKYVTFYLHTQVRHDFDIMIFHFVFETTAYPTLLSRSVFPTDNLLGARLILSRYARLERNYAFRGGKSQLCTD